MKLDEFDQAILALVQENNLLTHAQIGAKVNRSASAVRRRIHALTQAGLIVANVAITDPTKLGLTFVVQVALNEDDKQVDKTVSRSY